MPPAGGKKKSSSWADTLLVLVSILVCVAFAEGVVRFLNGQPLFAFPLPDPVGSASVKTNDLDKIPLAKGVDPAWFTSDPPPLPNRSAPPPGWQALFDRLRTADTINNDFLPNDAFKVWNSAFAGDPCKHRLLKYAPGRLYLYDPPDGQPTPRYRFYPNVTLPDRLVTNQIGWRGKPIENPRDPKTIRIVFAGSSTVVEGHFVPFSYPEFVGHWLNMWAEARHLDVRFEVLNSARESNDSTDIAATIRTEVLPLRPDLVVYYEGGNQFRPESVVDKVPEGKPVRPAGSGAPVSPEWLRTAARYSALAGRIQAAIGLAASDGDGREWPKPDYKIVWPQGLDEQDPDLAYPNLPVSLNVIERDLDRIRADLATVGSDFALSSFAWVVRDGLVVDPIRHKYIIEQLNVGNWPYRYRDLERLVKFENRVFAKYARVHGLPFVDVAGQLPADPDLFIDAVHTSYAGTRLRGWINLQALIPVIEKHLADGSWPRPPGPEQPLPTFTPREIKLSCTAPAR
ncbi:MAG: hypothetical protein JSR47_00630 [Proteobacteria bacterium]|nr:hypothetical protein [Pseudomonadota bacterium]